MFNEKMLITVKRWSIWSTMLRSSIISWHIYSVASVAKVLVSYHLYPSLVMSVLLNFILLLHTGQRFFLANSLSLWSHLINFLSPCAVLWSNILVNVILLKNTHSIKCKRCNIRCCCRRCSLEVNSVQSVHGVYMFQTVFDDKSSCETLGNIYR